MYIFNASKKYNGKWYEILVVSSDKNIKCIHFRINSNFKVLGQKQIHLSEYICIEA